MLSRENQRSRILFHRSDEPTVNLKRKRWLRWLFTVAIVTVFFVSIAAIVYLKIPAFRRAVRIASYKIGPVPAAMILNTVAVKLDVPFHRQEHALSCEVAALKMVLDYYGVAVSEAELIAALPFATREPRGKNNVWGDPDVGFVGDINGISPTTGYGVYTAPIAALAAKYRAARVLSGATMTKVLQEVAGGHPVIVWGTLSSGRDTSWVTPEGKRIKAIVGEHTRVAVGFTGSLQEPDGVLLLDPIYGAITMTKKKFSSNWGLLGNKAVVVY